MRLLRLPEDIQQWVEEERLSMGHARALLSLETPDEQRDLAKEIIARGLSVRDTERVVKRIHEHTAKRMGNLARADEQLDANVKAAEDKLSRRLGAKVKIQKLKNGGKIEIYFYSDAELDNIYTSIAGN